MRNNALRPKSPNLYQTPSRFQKDKKFFIDQTKTNIGYNMNTTQLLMLHKN